MPHDIILGQKEVGGIGVGNMSKVVIAWGSAGHHISWWEVVRDFLCIPFSFSFLTYSAWLSFFPSLFLFGFFPCATVGREWGWVGTYLPARDNPPQPRAVVGPGHAFRNPCYRLALFSWSAISDTSLSVLHIIRHKTQGCEQLILSSTGILYSYVFNPVTTCLIAWFLPLFHNSFSHAGVFQYWVESGLDPDFRLYQDQLFFT